MTLRLLDVHGQQVAVLSGGPAGGAPPVVFLHGILASSDVWLPTLPPAVCDGRRWHSLSLPGHTPPGTRHVERGAPHSTLRSPLSTLTPETFAHVLAAAIRQLAGGQPVELVGWSTGGFAALSLAAHFPEMVAGVMSISGFANGRWHGALGALQRAAGGGRVGRLTCLHVLRLLAANRRLHLAALRRQMDASHRRRTDAAIEETLDRLHEALRRHALGPLTDLMAGIRGFDLSPALPRIVAPTLILGGLRDPIIPAAHTTALAAAIPGAELVMVPSAGHFLFLEETGRYQRLLTDWLARRAESSLEPAFTA